LSPPTAAHLIDVRQERGEEMALQHPNMTLAHRQLTAKERQILEKQVLVHIGIVLPDGTPHVSAMWVDLDGEDIILNTAEGRTKANVLRLGSPVALSVLDPENPYRNLGLRGRVVEVISEERGAGVGINRLAKKYLGVEEYPYRTLGERRVQFRVRPEVVSGWGKD
jgi:PPOX class probable F420-dependent enzyme